MKNFNKILTGGLILFATTGLQADQVILDDLIVDGSTCVGQDCVNGESFGFDTIRLKENNLRIKFQDTSTTASFPSRDWQLTANDTSNGGANKFSIDDVDGGRTPFTIEAGAPSHSLYVDDGGRLGLGTSTPVVDVHTKSGNTPTLRLEQDGSSGFTAQTWDVAGNEANFFIRDVTNGSTLPFRIYPDAPTSALTIEGTTGDIGIGTASPDAALHVYQGDLKVEQTGAGVASKLQIVTANTTWEIKQNGSTGRLTFSAPSFPGAPFKFQPGAVDNLLRIGIVDLDTVDINGNLVINGSNITPDYVFDSDYPLESIEEHANLMWQNKHLPALPGATANEEDGVNVISHQFGVLEELEKAHIYIDQLHQRLKAMESEQEQLRQAVDLLIYKNANTQENLLTSSN